MTAIKEFKIEDAKESDINEAQEFIYIIGVIPKGKKKGKQVAFKIRNSMLMNPVAPVLEAFPELDCVIVAKTEKQAIKHIKKLVG